MAAHGLRWGWFVLWFLFAHGTLQAGQLEDRTFDPQDYPDSDRRQYYVYVPEGYTAGTPAPLVMVLHGCHQTRRTIIDEFGWDEVADRHGFILVAPDVTTRDPFRFPQCWGYWEAKEIHQGGGEVEDLHHIALAVEQQWSIDPRRRHIAGLSSGAFMANAAAVAHNEYWASAGIHSGGGYAESAGTFSGFCADPRESSGNFLAPGALVTAMRAEMNDPYAIPMMLIHSKNDCTVGYGVDGSPSEWGGLTANRDAWLQIHGGGSPLAPMDCARDGIACSHIKYGTSERSGVEVVSLTGLIAGTDQGKGHYWSGGETDGTYTKKQGPQTAELLWAFFDQHPRNGSGTTPTPMPSPTPITGCRTFSGAISAHVAAGRAYSEARCISFWCWFYLVPKMIFYYAAGSDEELGTDGSREVTLSSIDGVRFSTGLCDAN